MLQSIASVIQALPPHEAIPPIEVSLAITHLISSPDPFKAILNPVVAKLHEALKSSAEVNELRRAFIEVVFTIYDSFLTKHGQSRSSNCRLSQVSQRA